MAFALWFAPAAAFAICIARSALGQAIAARTGAAGVALLTAIRSLAVAPRRRVAVPLSPGCRP